MSAPMEGKIRVSIVENNADELALYASIVAAAPGMECVSRHPNGMQALRLLPEIKPDVVLVDVVMPRCSGIECVRQLKVVLPEIVAVMLTKHADDDHLFESLKAGASGYLIKAWVRESLPQMIGQAFAGEAVMTPEIARRVIAYFHKPPPVEGSPVQLTAREEEVLRLTAQGLSSKEIAELLGCSTNTVNRHVHHTCGKLQVSGRMAAVRLYFGKI